MVYLLTFPDTVCERAIEQSAVHRIEVKRGAPRNQCVTQRLIQLIIQRRSISMVITSYPKHKMHCTAPAQNL